MLNQRRNDDYQGHFGSLDMFGRPCQGEAARHLGAAVSHQYGNDDYQDRFGNLDMFGRPCRTEAAALHREDIPADRSANDDSRDRPGGHEPVEDAVVGTDRGALRLLAGAGEEYEYEYDLFTVTNPKGTVSVTALIDGSIHWIKLSAGVASMTEAELAGEIVVIAHLAQQKARSAQRTLMLQSLSEAAGKDAGRRAALHVARHGDGTGLSWV